jgi:hypothetical protein
MSLFAGRWHGRAQQEIRYSFRRREETPHPPMLPSDSQPAEESAGDAAIIDTGTSPVAAAPNVSPRVSEAAAAVSSPATGHGSAPDSGDDVTTLTVVTHNPPYESTVPNDSSSTVVVTDGNSPRSSGARSTAPYTRGPEAGCISPAQPELSPSSVGPVSELGRDLGPGTAPANASYIHPGALSLSGNASHGPRSQTHGLLVLVSEENENEALSMGDSPGHDVFAHVSSFRPESAAPTEDLGDKGNQDAMQEDRAANIV